MTTKTNITLPPLPPEDIADGEIRVWTTATLQSYARAAVEADRQGRMPSDEEILHIWGAFVNEPTEEYPLTDADKITFARAMLSRYSGGQPIASAEPASAVNRETVIEWLDALDIEVTDKQLDGLFHAVPVAAPVAQEPVGYGVFWREGGQRCSVLKSSEDEAITTAVNMMIPGASIEPVFRGAAPVAQVPVAKMVMPAYCSACGLLSAENMPCAYQDERRPGCLVSAPLAAPVAAQAQPSAQDVCQTCGSSGWVGGPSYYAPDEGGEPCPDCAQDREDAERYRWATALDDNSETLHSIVLSYGGDQAKINERVDVYRACDARAAKEQP